MNEKEYARMTTMLKQELKDIEAELERLSARADEIMELLYPDSDDVVLEPEPIVHRTDVASTKAERAAVEDALLKYINGHPGKSINEIEHVLTQYSRYDISHALTRLRNRKQLMTKGKGRGAVWHFVDESLV